MPGPGFYENVDSINESFNYGNSFISKSNRFPDQVKNTGPGPGAYHQTTALIKNHIKLRNSPIFHKRGSKNRFTKVLEIPGPGVYNAKKSKKNIPCAKYVFSSKVERLGGNNAWETPSPGQYMIRRDFEKNKSKSTKNSSFFLKPMNEGKNERDLIEEIKNFKDPLLKNSEEKTRKIDFKNKDFLKKIKYKKNPSLINKQDNKTNVPGPGAYIKVEVTKVKSAVSGAVFKSESERIAKMNENFDNLGPGSYKAFGQLKKQNFHYNMKQSWI